MKGGLGRDLLIYLAGIVLGYLFATHGGAKLVRAATSRLGAVDVASLGTPAVVTALIIVGAVVLFILSRRRK